MGRGLFQFLGEILGRLVVVRLQHPQIPVANRARQFEHSQGGRQARDAFVPGVVKVQISIGKPGALLCLAEQRIKRSRTQLDEIKEKPALWRVCIGAERGNRRWRYCWLCG